MRTRLITGAILCFAVATAAPALAANSSVTTIKSTRLHDVANGTGTYSGKVYSEKPRCLKDRKVTVIQPSTIPLVTIGTTNTNKHGKWSLDGSVPPDGTSQRIRVNVYANQVCGPAKHNYDIDDID
jgi:hypothetical protein